MVVICRVHDVESPLPRLKGALLCACDNNNKIGKITFP